MKNIEFENMVLGANKKEESIKEQPVWNVRCWLEGLNEGVILKVTKDGREYTDADELFREIVSCGDYGDSIEEGKSLTVYYKNGDTITLEGEFKSALELIKENNKIFSGIKDYENLQELYINTPEEFRHLLGFNEETYIVSFDNVDIGHLFAINDIICFVGKIHSNDKSKSELDKKICITLPDSFREIDFYYSKDKEKYVEYDASKEYEYGKRYRE